MSIAALANKQRSFELADGARASVDAASVEVRDRAGRLLVRYCDGSAEIAAPAGDLRLSAPQGRVVVESRAGVSIDTDGAFEVRGRAARLLTRTVELVADHVVTTAESVAHKVDRFETTARRVVERAAESFRFVADLAELRAGRVHTQVDELFSLRSRRTSIVSEQDTAIDGRRVLLG